MKVLFILLSGLQVPFLIMYSDYYARFIGEIEWIQYEHYLSLFYIGFAALLGIISSRIPFGWFISIGLVSIVSQVVLAGILIDADHNYYFKPFTSTMLITITATVYFLIQWLVRFLCNLMNTLTRNRN
ncbi:hypothetical protein [Alkalibacillus haloalkaliphilus]|uniref:Uncharacterized protein n=1 Tax=Alkalibacillus haloalkaliphilus TaxID=94136 RepID=A0A511W464_9BACI|nr:hypothetical protein [Alkalibacillus haloalkaliphilus]GEN45561.1 hypothetical protein AHA02nite_13370 [Alkalibacillus haloalkaliphilus]